MDWHRQRFIPTEYGGYARPVRWPLRALNWLRVCWPTRRDRRRRDTESRARAILGSDRNHESADQARADSRVFRIALTAGFIVFGVLSAWLLVDAMSLRSEARVLGQRDRELKQLSAELLAYLTSSPENRQELQIAFHRDLVRWCDDQADWTGSARAHFFRSEPQEASAYFGYLSAMSGRVSAERRRCDDDLAARWWNLYSIVVIALGLSVLALVLVNRNARARIRIADLYFKATRDPMTGGLNRAAVLEDGERNLARCQREGAALAVVIVDLDHFKAVNDTYGHAAGDRVIQLSAERLAENVRAYDSVGRYGGDEFLLVLPFADLEETQRIAERLSRAFAEPIRLPGMPRRVSVSIGGAVAVDPGMNLEELIASADRALYRQKARGRNGWHIGTAIPAKPIKKGPVVRDTMPLGEMAADAS